MKVPDVACSVGMHDCLTEKIKEKLGRPVQSFPPCARKLSAGTSTSSHICLSAVKSSFFLPFQSTDKSVLRTALQICNWTLLLVLRLFWVERVLGFLFLCLGGGPKKNPVNFSRALT